MYDDSNIISNTFFTELNKSIQSYGRISLQYDYNNEKVINWKNKLLFKINHNIKKKLITLQLEDILTPKKIEKEDLKITNISILLIAESKMQIKDEFIIEGKQNFEQYSNLILSVFELSIQIFRLNYYFVQRGKNIDLLLTVYYLVLQLKKTQRLFSLQQMT